MKTLPELPLAAVLTSSLWLRKSSPVRMKSEYSYSHRIDSIYSSRIITELQLNEDGHLYLQVSYSWIKVDTFSFENLAGRIKNKWL